MLEITLYCTGDLAKRLRLIPIKPQACGYLNFPVFNIPAQSIACDTRSDMAAPEGVYYWPLIPENEQ